MFNVWYFVWYFEIILQFSAHFPWHFFGILKFFLLLVVDS